MNMDYEIMKVIAFYTKAINESELLLDISEEYLEITKEYITSLELLYVNYKSHIADKLLENKKTYSIVIKSLEPVLSKREIENVNKIYEEKEKSIIKELEYYKYKLIKLKNIAADIKPSSVIASKRIIKRSIKLI